MPYGRLHQWYQMLNKTVPPDNNTEWRKRKKNIERKQSKFNYVIPYYISILVRNHCIIGFKTIFIRKSIKLEVLKNRLSSVMCTFNFTLTARVTSLRVSIFDAQPIWACILSHLYSSLLYIIHFALYTRKNEQRIVPFETSTSKYSLKF